MPVRILSIDDDKKYNEWIRNNPQGNLWQSLERKKYLEALGKDVRIYVQEDGGVIAASALVAIDRTNFGLCTWEIPRGPIGNNYKEILKVIRDDAKKDHCLAFYFSPYESCDVGKPSGRNVHAEATRIVDLTLSEEEMLAQMKQKGRYNIRVAQKNGIVVEESDDVDAFYKLAKATGKRDAFGILPRKHYREFLNALDGSFLLLARNPENNEAISGLLGAIWGSKGTYYYGASNYAHRAFMAPYLLQWKSMLLCKTKRCTQYDLLGVAPPNAPSSHPWSGITSFKEKFGGSLVTYPPERQILLRPMTHRLLSLKRKLFH